LIIIIIIIRRRRRRRRRRRKFIMCTSTDMRPLMKEEKIAMLKPFPNQLRSFTV